MCAEAVWWRCHRSLISDYLKARGIEVMHILDANKIEPHPFTSAARIVNGEIKLPRRVSVVGCLCGSRALRHWRPPRRTPYNSILFSADRLRDQEKDRRRWEHAESRKRMADRFSLQSAAGEVTLKQSPPSLPRRLPQPLPFLFRPLR